LSNSVLHRVDHLVYATRDMPASVADIERRLGVAATPGGRHLGRGTRNALIALGPSSYIEIIGPDPAQAPSDSPRWFGIDGLTGPRLVTWAAKGTDLERFAADAARRGVRLGAVGSGSRQRPDGVTLQWEFTDPTTVVADGLVPFFIDWGSSPHPAATAAPGPVLVGLRAEHPEPQRVRDALSVVGVELPTEPGPRPALIATLRGELGESELR